MPHTPYGFKFKTSGDIHLGRIYNVATEVVSAVLGQAPPTRLVMLGVGITNNTSVVVENYDTIGLNVQASVGSVRCDKETQRPYLVSILRGGSCNSGGGADNAAAITVTPTGNIQGDDVQEVLEELDSEIAALVGGSQIWSQSDW